MPAATLELPKVVFADPFITQVVIRQFYVSTGPRALEANQKNRLPRMPMMVRQRKTPRCKWDADRNGKPRFFIYFPQKRRPKVTLSLLYFPSWKIKFVAIVKKHKDLAVLFDERFLPDKKYLIFRHEPERGVEPPTSALQKHCSAIELLRRTINLPYFDGFLNQEKRPITQGRGGRRFI